MLDHADDPDQLILDIRPIVRDERPTPLTIQERFDRFHELNPWVLTAFERLTVDYLKRGHQRIGIKMLAEVLRWQYGRQTRGAERFKLSNDFTSRYARLIVERNPWWEGVFVLRELRSA